MPKREDERQLRLSGNHSVYCTCTACTGRFLNRKVVRSPQDIWQRWFGKLGCESVKLHARGYACATCKSRIALEKMPLEFGRRPGLLGTILGKK